jgi:hypothetical protein
MRNLSFNEKQAFLIKRFGQDRAHGWFDAISPEINDLLTFDELKTLLVQFGFANVKSTIKSRNHFIVADRI